MSGTVLCALSDTNKGYQLKNIQIRSVQEEDIDEIYNLSQIYQSNRDSGEMSKRGFLVSHYTKSDYLEFLKKYTKFYVALDNDVITGFLLAYTCVDVEDIALKSKIINNSRSTCILIKQVCISPQFARNGVGTLLYQNILSDVSNCNYFAAIVTKPKNIPSIRFHESQGFVKIFDFIPNDGIERGMWKR
jgi:ribosomal protein S18 acetylase RimI-like enzyme